jgi:FKBP12-rapamycin complex-associated protein
MTGLLAESYNRAYVDFVMNQQLGELEEIKDHKQLLKVAGLGIHTTSSHDVLFGSDNHSRSASASDLELLSGGGYQATSNAHMANIPSFLSLSGMNTDGGGSPPPQGGGGNQNAPNLNSSAKTALVAEAVTRKSFLIDKWKKRVRGCVSSGRAAITHWQNIMNVRKMLVGQREDVDTWLQFVVICRHGGNLALSQRALGLRIGEDPSIPRFENSSCFVPNFMDLHSTSIDYRIEFEKLRLQWSLGHKEYACEQLELIVQQLGDAINAASSSYAGHVEQQIAKVYLECLLKLGDWKLRLLGPGAVVDLKCRMEVLQLYQQATAVDPLSYRAWHQWGLSAWHAASSASQESTVPRKKFQLYKTSSFGQRPHRRPSMVSYDERTEMFAINSLRGLFRAMSLASGKHCASVMQDMLCILNFWFKYGEHSNIADVLREGLQSVPLDCWLGVLPQLIARIHHVGDVGRALLHDLLSRLGNHHAQALMYPLSVALQSPREDRQRAAQMLVMNLRQHSSQLIDQSVLVSQELVRIAILWDEEWYATIEDASRIFYNEGNIQKMLDLLLPLHDKMAGGSKTNTEAAFLQAYGGELREAHDFLTAYIRHLAARNVPIPTSGGCSVPKEQTAAMAVEKTYLTKAWDIYTIVIRRIHPTLKQITSHNLLNVSPQLVAAQHLDLAIPGTYTLRGDAVRIRGFRQHISIILSKQRPRKIFLLGENGLEYVFLLKGHEDLRQDERAMQLFGLVNALLKHDRRTDSHDLGIQRYAVVPLSPNVGLSGWVPKCDTLHDLIRNYRERKKIYLDIEHRLMEQLVRLKGSHDKLTTIQKLEVFEHSLKNTNGKDIHNILWHQATSSESWIIRREAYTKSLAVMSVVGYVLGLGDRHPSNLMLERDSCKILHIDFGDCFEVAMHRDKFPEKIPFRLTRMLVLGMEVAGVEGLFRLTCERVMKVMRENCDSLVAILEAFVHDPLLSWRLLNPNRYVVDIVFIHQSTRMSVVNFLCLNVAEEKLLEDLKLHKETKRPAPTRRILQMIIRTSAAVAIVSLAMLWLPYRMLRHPFHILIKGRMVTCLTWKWITAEVVVLSVSILQAQVLSVLLYQNPFLCLLHPPMSLQVVNSQGPW